jgi:hypothetical protein
MWNVFSKLKRWLLVFLIATNIAIPLADSVAYGNHPNDRSTDIKATQISYMRLILNISSGENDNKASDKEGGQGHCIICLNAHGLPVSYNEISILPSSFYVLESVNLTLLERLSSIYKPPKTL